MIEDRKWACPCCGGETVEVQSCRCSDRLPARDCASGCSFKESHDAWHLDSWWHDNGILRNESPKWARTYCRDLPGPCGTRPEARAPTLRVGMRVERLHDDGEVRTGTLGTVRGINDDGDACVAWDNGSCVEYFNTTGLRIIDDAATAKTGDASASPSVALCRAERCVVCGSDACLEVECRNGHAQAYRYNGRVVCCRECSYAAMQSAASPPTLSCPRCGIRPTRKLDGEDFCDGCGWATRYLRAEAPVRDPYAAMRARYAERETVRAAAARRGPFGPSLLAVADFNGVANSATAHVPCIHVQRGRGATACVCERAQRSGR